MGPGVCLKTIKVNTIVLWQCLVLVAVRHCTE